MAIIYTVSQKKTSTFYFLNNSVKNSFKCFDAVGWAAGRASGLQKLSGGVQAWLFVWSEVQTCRQLMPLPLTVSCFSKIQIGFTFLVPAHPSNPGKMAVKWVCVCVCVSVKNLPILMIFGKLNPDKI